MAITPRQRLATTLQASARNNRRPSHPFSLHTRPWQIQPFLLAPVLPGETLRNLQFQSRVITDPIKNAITGWFTEYYFFYVKVRDLEDRDVLEPIFLDPAADVSALDEAAKVYHYHADYGAGVGVNWTGLCLERVVGQYFRDEGESTMAGQVGDLPAAQIGIKSVLDSSATGPAVDADDVVVEDGADADTDLEASEVDAAMRLWELNRMAGSQMTYEAFLRSYGVRAKDAEELHRPELLRYVRDWSYPTNTVDPATGVPASAVSWSVAERADKRRFFPEPGFIFGVTVCRPKVYRSGQVGSVADLMVTPYTWLPAMLTNEFHHSIITVPETTGPLPSVTEDYKIDVRDLLLYGDQFVNHSLTAANTNVVAIPTTTLQLKYPTNTDADALFAGTPKTIRQDGIVSLTIAGRQIDQSGPGMSRLLLG